MFQQVSALLGIISHFLLCYVVKQKSVDAATYLVEMADLALMKLMALFVPVRPDITDCCAKQVGMFAIKLAFFWWMMINKSIEQINLMTFLMLEQELSNEVFVIKWNISCKHVYEDL